MQCQKNVNLMYVFYFHPGLVQLRPHRQRLERHQFGRLPIEDRRSDAFPFAALSPVSVPAHVRPIEFMFGGPTHPAKASVNHHPPSARTTQPNRVPRMCARQSAQHCHNVCHESLFGLLECVCVLFCLFFCFHVHNIFHTMFGVLL